MYHSNPKNERLKCGAERNEPVDGRVLEPTESRLPRWTPKLYGFHRRSLSLRKQNPGDKQAVYVVLVLGQLPYKKRHPADRFAFCVS